MGKRYVDNVSALSNLFPYPLSDLVVACSVSCQTDLTNRRCHPRSGLPVPTSIAVAFVVLPKLFDREISA